MAPNNLAVLAHVHLKWVTTQSLELASQTIKLIHDTRG